MTTPKHTPFNPFSLLKPTNQTGHSQQLVIMSKIKVVTSTLPKPLATIHMVSTSAQHKSSSVVLLDVSSTSTPKSNLSPSALDSTS